jgi:hypothetical protein
MGFGSHPVSRGILREEKRMDVVKRWCYTARVCVVPVGKM